MPGGRFSGSLIFVHAVILWMTLRHDNRGPYLYICRTTPYRRD
jgi:hypothetical protein